MNNNTMATKMFMSRLLFNVILECDYKSAKGLLERGACPNEVLTEGATPFHIAVGLDNPEHATRFIKLLLEFGGNPNVRSAEGVTPLHVAASYGCCYSLDLLLAAGADASLTDWDGASVLEYAEQSGCDVCVRKIKEHTAGGTTDSTHALDGDPGHSSSQRSHAQPGHSVELCTKRRTIGDDQKGRISVYTSMVQKELDDLDPVTQYFDVTSPDHPQVVLRDSNDDLPDSSDLENTLESNMEESYYTCKSDSASPKNTATFTDLDQTPTPAKKGILKKQSARRFSDKEKSDLQLDKQEERNEAGVENLESICDDIDDWVHIELPFDDQVCENNNVIQFGFSLPRGNAGVTFEDWTKSWNKAEKAVNKASCSEGNDTCGKKTKTSCGDKSGTKGTWDTSELVSEQGKELDNNVNNCTACAKRGERGRLCGKSENWEKTEDKKKIKWRDVNSKAQKNGKKDIERKYCQKQRWQQPNDHEAMLAAALEITRDESDIEDQGAPASRYAIRQGLADSGVKAVSTKMEEMILEPKGKTGALFHSEEKQEYTPKKCRQNLNALFNSPNKSDSPHSMGSAGSPAGTRYNILPGSCLVIEDHSAVPVTAPGKNNTGALFGEVNHLKIQSSHMTACQEGASDALFSLPNGRKEVKSKTVKPKPFQSVANRRHRNESFEMKPTEEQTGSVDVDFVLKKNTAATPDDREERRDDGQNSQLKFDLDISDLLNDPDEFNVNSAGPYPRYSSRQPSLDTSRRSSCSNCCGPLNTGMRVSDFGCLEDSVLSYYSIDDVEEIVHTDESGFSVIEMHYGTDVSNLTDLSLCSQCSADNTLISSQVARLSDQELFEKLANYGEMPGPVTSSTRRTYEKKLAQLMKDPTTQKQDDKRGSFQPELKRVLSGDLDVSTLGELEEEMVTAFQKSKKEWREGSQKSSFNYLLLDPRITKNLPARAKCMDEKAAFQTFLSSVFYVGKGKKSRPFAHFKEAIKAWNNQKKVGSKVQRILEVWQEGLGVISLQVFMNIIPVEAYTREGCMIEALGMDKLTNIKRGEFYGAASSWTVKKRRLLGARMLNRAFRIFLLEGERQIRPGDVKQDS